MTKIYYDNGSVYEGEVNGDGLPNGFGKVINLPGTGVAYEGQWVDGLRSGKGKAYYDREMKKLFFNGSWEKDSCFEAKMYHEDGKLYYEGEIKNDKFHGYGTFYYEDRIYIGNFENGEIKGSGRVKFANNRIIEGVFSSEHSGEGCVKYDGFEYRGKFKDYKPEGKVTILSPDEEQGNVIEATFYKGKGQGPAIQRSCDKERSLMATSYFYYKDGRSVGIAKVVQQGSIEYVAQIELAKMISWMWVFDPHP